MSIIEKMGKNFEKMTDGEKKIYHYIMKNTLTFSLKSINEVSEDLDMSKTSLMRFAKNLGFNGYSQFKKTFQEEQILESSPADRMKKLYESDYIMGLEKTKNMEFENISSSLLNINDLDFNMLIEEIMNKKKIFTMGWDVSRYLSGVLNFRLNHLGFDSREVRRDVIDFDVQLMHAKKDDILIVFDFYKYSKAIERAIAICKEKGSKIVLISDDLSCPSYKHSDMAFLCNVKTDILMNSMIAPMFLINLIVSELVYRLDKKIIDIFDDRHEIMKKSGEYF
ncbi:MAG: MurR/RpiR family transcriptional regulator [Firmicutes bacterium]|jgi:DNA-binding MurR/RpiR family transcriptional regulator|nr:MurR/RpiR family transcriptional regulator [Bacillota bacterium]